MSQTAEIFFSKHAKPWKAIISSAAFKDAIDTIKQTTECFDILSYSPPEIEGIGKVLLAELRGGLKTLKALEDLADVPPEIGSEEPPENELYPDPLDELVLPNRTKPKRRR